MLTLFLQLSCGIFVVVSVHPYNNYFSCNEFAECQNGIYHCLPGGDCTIECTGALACDGATFHCPSGNFDCTVTCESSDHYSCSKATFNASKTDGGDLRITAKKYRLTLDRSNILCPKNGGCYVTCDGIGVDNICQSMTVTAQPSTTILSVTGSGDRTLAFSNIICPYRLIDGFEQNCYIYVSGSGENMLIMMNIYVVEGLRDVSLTCEYITSPTTNCYYYSADLGISGAPYIHYKPGYTSTCQPTLVSGYNDWQAPGCDDYTLPPFSDPTVNPTLGPTLPTNVPTSAPSFTPTRPSSNPTISPTPFTLTPTVDPTIDPTIHPTFNPTNDPTTKIPTDSPSRIPTVDPTNNPTQYPSIAPTEYPTIGPTQYPSINPTQYPSIDPTNNPTKYPTVPPSFFIFVAPSQQHQDNDTVTIYVVVASVVIILISIILVSICFNKKRLKSGCEKEQNAIELQKNVKRNSNTHAKSTKWNEFKYENIVPSAPIEQIEDDSRKHNKCQLLLDMDDVAISDSLKEPGAGDKTYENTIQPTGEIEGENGINEERAIIKHWFDTDVCLHDNNVYYNLFIQNGFDKVSTIKCITDDELKEIGIDKMGHRKAILLKRNKL